MEVGGMNSEVSFVSLLMAPETTTNEFYETTENFKNFLSPSSIPPSMPPCSDHDYYSYYNQQNDNSNNNLHFLSPPLEPNYFLPPLLQPSLSPEFSTTGLPDLLSFETFLELPPLSNSHSPQPQPQVPPPPPPPPRDDYSLDSILESYLKSSKGKRISTPSSVAKAASQRQRTYRKSKRSEKIYCLGKLLPGGHRHRKNTADMLEEARKYVMFLQAQVNSLRTMPTESRFSESQLGVRNSRGIEELRKLSRQQLLQVVVNSPAAQIVMADKGWCLATAEQVALMKRIEARQKVIQQLMHTLPL